MKRIISVLLVFVLSVSLSGCAFLTTKTTEKIDPMENAKQFYDTVNESKNLLDLVATDVCAAWKDAAQNYSLSTKEVNEAIEKAKQLHSENIAKINELDQEIRDLFDIAKDETKEFSAEDALKQVMTDYSEYKDSVLNANEALDPSGYFEVSLSKEALDSALQELFVEL